MLTVADSATAAVSKRLRTVYNTAVNTSNAFTLAVLLRYSLSALHYYHCSD
jgi:hypothetical protein